MTRFACFSLISMTAEDARTEYLASLQNRTHVDPHSFIFAACPSLYVWRALSPCIRSARPSMTSWHSALKRRR